MKLVLACRQRATVDLLNATESDIDEANPMLNIVFYTKLLAV